MARTKCTVGQSYIHCQTSLFENYALRYLAFYVVEASEFL